MEHPAKLILESVQKNFPAIDKAARAFIFKLSMSGAQTDIELAAEMAGLSLLRGAAVDLSKFPPGSAILGAVDDARGIAMHNFLRMWAKLNGLILPGPEDFKMPDTLGRAYHPELTQFEGSFQQICTEHGIAREHFPYVAATTALLIVLSADKLKLLDAKRGQVIAQFHFVAGCKTAPYPPPSTS